MRNLVRKALKLRGKEWRKLMMKRNESERRVE